MKNYLLLYKKEMNYLASEIAAKLKIKKSIIEIGKYKNDNSFVKICDIKQFQFIFVLSSSFKPVNDSLIESLFVINSIKMSNYNTKVILIEPHFPYARSDIYEKNKSFSMPFICKLYKNSGVDLIIAVDLHNPATSGFIDIPFYNISTVTLFSDYISQISLPNLSIATTDFGGTKRAEELAERLNIGLIVLKKLRKSNNSKFVREVVGGEIKNKNIFVYDEEVVTGNSKCIIVNQLIDLGAKSVHALFTHADLKDELSYSKLLKSKYKTIALTNSTPVVKKMLYCGGNSKIKILSLGNDISNLIKERIMMEDYK